MDRQQRNKDQRLRRMLNNNAYTKKYEKTKKGFLMRAYRNMQSRVKGIQKKKLHLYRDKELISKSSFYDWSNNNNKFNELFELWESTNYERRLTPSVDRIDSSLGYVIENMEWVPFYINCSRASKSKIIKN